MSADLLRLSPQTRATATRALIALPGLSVEQQGRLILTLLQVAYAEGAVDAVALIDAGTQALRVIQTARAS